MLVKVKHIAIPTFLVLCCSVIRAQSRLVMNNNVYMVMQNGVQLVIGGSSSVNLTTTGSGGNIVSENENNKIKWMTGSTTGIYTIPFTTTSGIKIPLLVNINTAGTGSGYCSFSTYAGSWNNSTYMPTDVTHMNGLYTGTDNSSNTIDRFWIIDALGYTTKPGGNITLTYNDNEHTATGNSITESDLKAQRFNNTLNTWGDYLPAGTINTSANTVSGIPFSNTSFFRSWTLSENSNPLPVELLSAKLECNNTRPVMYWQTASETNNDYFTIQGSTDGVNYYDYTTVMGSGTTNTTQAYEHQLSNDFAYYKLWQTDFDGTTKELGVFYNGCENMQEWGLWYAANDPGTIVLQDIDQNQVKLQLFSTGGQLIWQQSVTSTKGLSEYKLASSMVSGLYVLKATRKSQMQSVKIIW